MSTTNFCRLVEERKASARLYSWHKKQQFVQHLASSSLSIFPLGNEVCRMTFVKCYLECGMFQIIHEIFNFKFFSIFHGGVWCEWISLISCGNTNSDKFCNTTSSVCNRNWILTADFHSNAYRSFYIFHLSLLYALSVFSVDLPYSAEFKLQLKFDFLVKKCLAYI